MLGNVTSSACLCARLAQLQAEGMAADEHSALAKAFCTVRMRESVGYARELLQLFSIGTVEIQDDGTPLTDAKRLEHPNELILDHIGQRSHDEQLVLARSALGGRRNERGETCILALRECCLDSTA